MSLVIGFIQWVSLYKGRCIPFRGQLILLVFAIISLGARLSSIVLYFAPCLGLFNLLGHYEAGKFNVSDKSVHIFDFNITTQPTKAVQFEEKWKQLSDYTELTVFSLEQYYIFFLFLICLHYVSVAVIKFTTALGFRPIRQSKWIKLFHILTQLVYPYNYQDWEDTDHLEKLGTVQRNWKQVSKEMKILVALFAVEHLILCTPIFILYSKILERNIYLDELFPLVSEEEQSTRWVYFIEIVKPRTRMHSKLYAKKLARILSTNSCKKECLYNKNLQVIIF